MSAACRFIGISRQAYYKSLSAQYKRQIKDNIVVEWVKRERQVQPRIGVRKLHHLFNQRAALGFHMGRDRLFDVLREHRLLITRRRAYHKTTHSHHRFRCHPNLLKHGPNKVTPSGLEQVWVADITYLPVRHGDVYLSLVTDLYSRKIVGHYMHNDLKTVSVINAFQNALKRRIRNGPLIHHSDRGVQYCSEVYQQLHRKHDVRCSMTDGYDCYQNAVAERVNGILKTELLPQRSEDIKQARVLVDEAVDIYNNRRPHMALKYKTPDAVHRAFQ